MLNGRATAEWGDGVRYSGDLVDGLRHGDGVMEAADGSVYRGQFRDDKRHGRGTLTLADGSYVKHNEAYEGSSIYLASEVKQFNVLYRLPTPLGHYVIITDRGSAQNAAATQNFSEEERDGVIKDMEILVQQGKLSADDWKGG